MNSAPRHRPVASLAPHAGAAAAPARRAESAPCRPAALLALALASALAAPTLAQPAADPAQTMAYIYNLGKFTEWPPAALGPPGRPITLCMMGDTEALTLALAAIENRPMQGRELRVRHMSYLGEPLGCQILFVARSEQRHLAEILPAAHASAALTVSDIADFADIGGIIGLLPAAAPDGKLEFSVNAGVARQAGLRLSSQVLKLARNVVGR
ncbi:YfiR family protein [Rugamonas sp. CCM 8940]|uniref:YfiR family protein n=1 Tax=Rugamonas sp. CCM 8940 TaxID=2765359 RepID=UPI0018F2C41C|nr:YfiR family protein [Rugamonas sp. CCM 8940]MBJ7314375.1 YfiR family protein [Rugamonas sp. CCM 8940]